MFKKKSDLLNGPVLGELLLFAFPLFLSYLFQQLYNTVDTVIVGNYLGELSLAAIGASMALYQLLLGFTFGFSGGFSVVIARAFGAGDETLLKKNVAASIVISGGLIVIIMFIGIYFLRPLLVMLKTPEAILELTYDYTYIIILFTGVSLVYNLTSGYLRSIGNSMVPLVILIGASVLNIGLDLLFIGILGKGVAGAAVATVIAQSVAALLTVVYIWRRETSLIPQWQHFRPDMDIYRELFGQGLSMAMMLSFVFVGTIILQYAINQMGYLTIAGHTTARRLTILFMMPISSISLAATTFVSQNKGADQGGRIIQAVRYANIVCILYSMAISVIVFLFAEGMMMTVSGSSENDVILNGSNYLKFNVPFFVVVSVLLVTRYSLQGLGEKLKPLVSSVIELVMKLAFALVIIPIIGYTGVIISEPIIWIFMTLHLVYAYQHHPYILAYR